MQIIDLLIQVNKFNNGKCASLPNKIKWNTRYYYLKEDAVDGHFYYDNSSYKTFIAEIDNFTQLNDEVEIIGKDKEIEKIDIMSDEATPNSYYILNEHGTKCYLTKHSKVITDRVNLLIDKINSLENKQ